jgi:hypothetical protein
VLQLPRGLLHQIAQPIHLLPLSEHLIKLFRRLLPAPPSDDRVDRLKLSQTLFGVLAVAGAVDPPRIWRDQVAGDQFLAELVLVPLYAAEDLVLILLLPRLLS